MKELLIADFGKTNQEVNAKLYTLTNEAGVRLSTSDFGATLVKLIVPDSNGTKRDVVLGYDDIAGYIKGDLFFGAIVGRNANRIQDASFEIKGVKYQLSRNDGENSLHSGPDTYNKRMWNVKYQDNHKITYVLHSPDKDQGFPGNVDIEVTYELTDDNEVKIHYFGTPDQDTVINMTNHSYFNLNGHETGSIRNHTVMIDADTFTPSDEHAIPTGEILSVKDTPMDFLSNKAVGKDMDADYYQLVYGRGYDHNYVLKWDGSLRKIAEATGDDSNIRMEVYTDLPGVHFYSANYVEDEHGKGGAIYQPQNALCFETQYFPDAVHHSHFKQPICKAGESYETSTVFKFIVD